MKTDRPICCDDRALHVPRDGALSADRQHLLAHVEACPDCRSERQLMADFEQSASAQPLDEQLIARAAARALPPVRARRLTWQRWSVAAAALLLAAGAASASIMLRTWHANEATRANEIEQRKVRARTGHRAKAAPSAPVPVETPEAATPVPALEAPVPPAPPAPAVEAPARARVASPRLAANGRRPELPASREERPETAARLFASALEDRDGGQLSQAIATLRALEQRFPDSSQALVARVSRGDLLLRVGSAAEALLAFDSYLGRAPSGNLAPEALAGKVRALEALGRTEEAKRLRQEMAGRFPFYR